MAGNTEMRWSSSSHGINIYLSVNCRPANLSSTLSLDDQAAGNQVSRKLGKKEEQRIITMQMNFGINADGIKTTLFVPNYCIVLAGIPLHLHTVKLVAKLQQRKEN